MGDTGRRNSYGGEKLSKEEPVWGLSVRDTFAGWMAFLSSNQQCQSTDAGKGTALITVSVTQPTMLGHGYGANALRARLPPSFRWYPIRLLMREWSD